MPSFMCSVRRFLIQIDINILSYLIFRKWIILVQNLHAFRKQDKWKKGIWKTLVYTNPPSVLKYRPVLAANLRAAARLSNLVLCCHKHLVHCGCTKAGSRPAQYFWTYGGCHWRRELKYVNLLLKNFIVQKVKIYCKN